mmetsp:Transcript_45222/g.98364  ORF Transcript_45222/g.98364 Transcript_45222/m.98364 type:complete len:227 (+) Transcript_45222:661-1341(+)
MSGSSSSPETSASWSPVPQCHCVLAFIRRSSTSSSSCFAAEDPASALSIFMPAMRLCINCCTLSPGRRVSMPLTAFWRQSSWSMAEPASNTGSASAPAPSSPSDSEPSSESEPESSICRLGPLSCLSSVTKKEKSRAARLPSADARAASALELAAALPSARASAGAAAAAAACCAPPAGTIAVAWAARRGFISANIGCTRASAAFTALGSKADSRSFLALGGDRRR